MNKILPVTASTVPRQRAQGFSLLEVLLAMGILFGSLAVLSQLAALGIEHLNRAETTATAVRLCQNKLGEILAGIQPFENIEAEPFIEDPQWNYTIQIQPLETLALAEVRVEVAHTSEVERKPSGRRGRYELVRWVYRVGDLGDSERALSNSRFDTYPKLVKMDRFTSLSRIESLRTTLQ